MTAPLPGGPVEPVVVEPVVVEPTTAADLRGYSATSATGLVDEAVDRDTWRGGYADLARQRCLAQDLPATAVRVSDARRSSGVVYSARVDGRVVEQPFPLDVVPRVVSASDWAHLSAGVVQRTRALEAFLQDVYPADPGRVPAVVADGVVPRWLVRDSPGYAEHAHGRAPGPAPRITVSGLDLLKDGAGPWRVLEDNLRVPSGLGYAMANRACLAAAVPGLLGSAPPLLDPHDAPALLRTALDAAAPPRCRRPEPSVVLVSDGPGNTAWFEHRMLAAQMDVPIATPADLFADGERVVVRIPGPRGDRVLPVDVLYRRLDEADLPALTAGDGTPLDQLLVRASAAGVLSIANAPGNGVADDKATYAYVPAMIRYYLGEEPVLADVPTWVLADPSAYAEARDRLAELVVKPVDGYGGVGVVFGPTLTPQGLHALAEAVDAAPHRFVAQQPVSFTTHPTVCGGELAARHVDLRVFAISSGGRGPTVAAPAPLTRVALRRGSMVVNSSAGGGSKDTWVLRG